MMNERLDRFAPRRIGPNGRVIEVENGTGLDPQSLLKALMATRQALTVATRTAITLGIIVEMLSDTGLLNWPEVEARVKAALEENPDDPHL